MMGSADDAADKGDGGCKIGDPSRPEEKA